MINTLSGILTTIYNVRETGFENVDDSDLDEVLFAASNVFEQISKYTKKHPIALDCPDDYIYQSDSAQIDAIDLTSNICKCLEDYSEYESEK